MADLEQFRAETRSWLEANCPPEMREPVDGPHGFSLVVGETFKASGLDLPVEHPVCEVFGTGPGALRLFRKITDKKGGS